MVVLSGFNATERFIEIPWCLQRYRKERVVLDVGYAHAESEYLQGLANMNIPELYGVDIAPVKHIQVTDPTGVTRPMLTPVQADIRKTPFNKNFFDLVFCISTIEHIGMNNEGYNPAMEDMADEEGDFEAIREMFRITKPGGRLLLTVPFGKYQRFDWFQQYDLDRLARMIGQSGYYWAEANFFRYHNGWQECCPSEIREVGYQERYALNAAGLACLELEKRLI